MNVKKWWWQRGLRCPRCHAFTFRAVLNEPDDCPACGLASKTQYRQGRQAVRIALASAWIALASLIVSVVALLR